MAVSRVLLVLSTCAVPSCHSVDTPHPLITHEQVRACELDPHTAIEGALKVRDGPDLKFSFQITTKGNGAVEISNLWIRLYDLHDNGSFHDPPMLDHTVLTDEQGYFTGLMATGVQVLTPEQGAGELGRRKIQFECRYDVRTKRLIVLRDDGSIAWER